MECHPILDGWSHNSLVTELVSVYRALRDGDTVPAETVHTGRFADFIALEQRAVASAPTRQFWAERVRDHEPLRLPAAWADPGTTEVFPYDLPIPIGDLLPGLRALGRAAGASLKSVLLAAHLTVLRRLTDEPRFHTGLATNGRPETPGGDQVRGMFLNLVPFAAPAPAATWRDLVRATFAEEVALWPHRRYPAPAIQRAAGDDGRSSTCCSTTSTSTCWTGTRSTSPRPRSSARPTFRWSCRPRRTRWCCRSRRPASAATTPSGCGTSTPRC